MERVRVRKLPCVSESIGFCEEKSGELWRGSLDGGGRSRGVTMERET